MNNINYQKIKGDASDESNCSKLFMFLVDFVKILV